MPHGAMLRKGKAIQGKVRQDETKQRKTRQGLLFFLLSSSRFDLFWFRLSSDHGWIRRGLVNER